MNRLKAWLAKYRRARALRIIRDAFKASGYDLSEMSDEDIEAGVFKTCELMRLSGVEIKQAQEALYKFATAACAAGELT